MVKNLKCWKIINYMLCALIIYSSIAYITIITDKFTDDSAASRFVRAGVKSVSDGFSSICDDISGSLREALTLEPMETTAYAGTIKEDNINEARLDISEKSSPTEFEIMNVQPISQMPELPTGCEVSTAAMLLKWYGIDTNKVEIARAIPKGSVPYRKNGKMYGGNPNEVFIGDPFSSNGFGVFHQPIVELIESFVPGQVLDITGAPFEDLLEVVASGRPVIVWVTRDMAPPGRTLEWYDDGGDKIIWKAPEHTVLLIGYNKDQAIVINPYNGKREQYGLASFKGIWEAMGSQAVTVKLNTKM